MDKNTYKLNVTEITIFYTGYTNGERRYYIVSKIVYHVASLTNSGEKLKTSLKKRMIYGFSNTIAVHQKLQENGLNNSCLLIRLAPS